MSSFVTVDTSGLASMAQRVGEFGKEVDRIQVRSLNRAAEKGRTAAKREIVARVNLKSSYVLEKLKIRKASADRPEAAIATPVRGVSLAAYSPRQVTRAAKRAKGDPARGIAPGRKQAGVSVSVTSRGRRPIQAAFMIPLRAGRGDSATAGANGMGVFVRVGSGPKDYAPAYGPSVHQEFRIVMPDLTDEVAADFAAEAGRLTELAMKKINP